MNTYDELKSSGITENTPKNIMLGAGTFHKGLKYESTYILTEDKVFNEGTNYYTRSGEDGAYKYIKADVNIGEEVPADMYYVVDRAKWNFAESLIGATSGGGKISIKPEIKNIEVDGALVKVMGLAVKVGETASIETKMVEMTPDWIKMAVIGQEGVSDYEDYSVIESKRQIETGDYIEKFGFIGKKMDGTPIIIIFDYALCTTGFEMEGKNKENGVFTATFECYAKLSSEADILPYHIYYPKTTQ